MKTLIIFILLGIPLSINAQCKLKAEVDPFDGTKRISSPFVPLSSMFPSMISLQTIQLIVKDDTTMNIIARTTFTSMQCFDDNSKIEIKAGDSIITVRLLNGIDCGNDLFNYGVLLPEDVVYLKSNPMQMIRLYYADGYVNYNIKKPNYFIETLKCF